MEFVDLLKNPEKYKELGARPPKGVLLLGILGVQWLDFFPWIFLLFTLLKSNNVTVILPLGKMLLILSQGNFFSVAFITVLHY